VRPKLPALAEETRFLPLVVAEETPRKDAALP
jgi:hypothetical protein